MVSELIVHMKFINTSNCPVSVVVWHSVREYRSSSRSLINHQGALLVIEVPPEDSGLLSYLLLGLGRQNLS